MGMRQAALATAVLTVVAGLLLASCTAQAQQVGGDGSKAGGIEPSSDCGRVSLGQGDSVPTSYLTCFSTAVEGGSSGTLTVVSPTTEGDGIVTTYTVVASGSVRVRMDATADKFGGTRAHIFEQTCEFRVDGGKIRTDECTELVPV